MFEIRSLYSRLALTLLGVVLLLGLGWIGSTLLTTRLHLEELDQRLNRDLATHLVADSGLLREGELQQERLERLFHNLMVINPRIEVYLLDTEGRILAYSAPEGRVRSRRVSLEPVRTFLDAGGPFPLRGDDPRHPGQRRVFSAAPIPAGAEGDAVESYLYVVLGGDAYESVARMLEGSYILRLSVWIGLAAVLVAAVTGGLIFHLLTRRLRRLDRRMRGLGTSGSDALGSGALPLGEGIDGHGIDGNKFDGNKFDGDEIDRLEATFDRMAERISRQMEELQRHDRLRRELIANVSHDLRTPLAGLHGYLETLLLKGETLPPEEAHSYLETALAQSDHLGELVSQLFELASLEAGAVELHPETFSLSELAQDIVQKFHLSAERAGVALDAELPDELALVRGDVRLIERVLDNLIENGLRYTPEGGRVRVGLRTDDGAVEVRVEDDGPGIPRDELPRIFDRFYRGAEDRRKHNAGIGLGLAIARRAMELHGSELEVESVEGRGTCFHFRLPRLGT
jgi:two-component system OmpR family sensor kinase